MNDTAWKREANKQLKKEGLRLASSNEAGWYHYVKVEDERVRVWVTD